ncbi:MAG: hypothetical protein P4L84_08730 [Isosphaeraceae bacterium]|nr:hypothetical protein [Isosphaeraceae bacterium]
MSTIFHGFLSAAGRGFDFLCRPVTRRVDAQVQQLLETRLNAELEARLVPTLSAALAATAQTLSRLDSLMEQTSRSTRETDETLNLLLDEVSRLRDQVEALQQPFSGHRADGEADGRAELAIVDHDDACDGFVDEPIGERARVG